MMRRPSILRVSALLSAAVLAVSASPRTALTGSLAVPRPIGDFIEAQGTFCLDDGKGGCSLFAPPVRNFVGWTSPGQNRAASVDYAGLANKAILAAGGASLGTVTEGTVLERPLADGRAEVTVTLHTRRTLSWVIEGDGRGHFDFGAGALLFGQRVPEVLGGARPALGDSLLEVVFTNPAPGARLPDLEQILLAPAPGQELRFISLFASAGGPRREEYGVADGTARPMEVAQSGLLLRPSEGAAGDGLPAQRIDLGFVAATQPACPGKSACDDGNSCTFKDRCVNGVCQGTPYSCDDGNVCTLDVCDGAGGCRNLIDNNAPCNDGNACTSNDICSNGACVSGPPTVCNDGNVCTTDSCDPATGCIFTNNSAPCDDGNACTHTDTCGGGACSGTAYTCNDNNACTSDICDGAGGCTFINNCDDGNPCTIDSCDPATGCFYTNVADGTPCDDGWDCTTDDACWGGYCTGTFVPGPGCFYGYY